MEHRLTVSVLVETFKQEVRPHRESFRNNFKNKHFLFAVADVHQHLDKMAVIKKNTHFFIQTIIFNVHNCMLGVFGISQLQIYL